MNTRIHEHIRTSHPTKDHQGRRLSKNAPTGVVLVERQGNKLCFGWSLCNIANDPFDKEEGISRAEARLGHPVNLNTVPPKVRKALLKLQVRALKYFQGKI